MGILFSALLPFVWHIGIATTLLVLCGLGIWLVASLRVKVLLADLALMIVIAMGAYFIGVVDEHRKCVANQTLVEKKVDTAVANAAHAPLDLLRTNGVRDRWDRDWKR